MSIDTMDEKSEIPHGDAGKHYFAFISYSRSDLSAAQYVQRTLEHFRYPRDSIRKEYHPDDREYVREIFLDKTGLSGRGQLFEQRLEAALTCSRYLIVICSRRAAQKKSDPRERHYVEWEIQTFLKHHGNDVSRIIPMILDGEPNQKDDSCLPEPLRTNEFTSRNLPDMRPQTLPSGKSGGKKANWQSAIVTLLSYVFNVERSIIFDRFAAERAKTRARIAIGLMAGGLIAAVLAAWGIVEQRRAADREAERHLVEAIGLMNQDSHGVFPDTGLALAHLSRASRLPLANEYLVNQLMQRSWIVPARKRPVADKDIQAVMAKNTMERIVCPDDFPFVYSLGNGELTACHREATAKNGIRQEAWRVGEKSADGFWGMSGMVSPLGRTLLVLRLPRNGHPQYEIVAFNPFTGQRMWGRDVPHPVHFCGFSGDGNRVALRSSLGVVRILNALTGEAEFEPFNAGSDVLDVSFTNDDSGLVIVCKKHVIECSFVKSMVEFPFRPTGYPIVAQTLSADGKSITLEMNTGGTFGFADTYDCRTFERLGRVDLTNVVVRTAAKAKESTSGDGRFRANVADGRLMKNAVRLFDSRSSSAMGRLLQFPNEVKNLSFIKLGRKEYLLVLGGAYLSVTIKDTAFYAVVDPETGRTVRLRQGLPNQLDTAFPLGGGAMMMFGQNNNECRLAILPCAVDHFEQRDVEAVCRLLGGIELYGADMPVARIATLDQITASGTLRRFVEFCKCSAERRAISFASEMPFSLVLNEETDDDGKKSVNLDSEMRNEVLSVIPGHPLAWEDGWIGDLQRIYRENYAYAHKELSPYKVDMTLAGMGTVEWRDALAEDPQVCYYADRITKYMVKRHPREELVKKARATSEDMFGK